MAKILAAYIDAAAMDTDFILETATDLQNRGVDELVITNFTTDESEREAFLEQARALSHAVDIPFIIGTYVHRFEDSKKAFYTGASAVILREKDIAGTTLQKESADRFGEGNIFVLDVENKSFSNAKGTKWVICDTESIGAELENGADGAAVCFNDTDIMALKRKLASYGLDMNTFMTDVTFESLKKDALGLVPCIVQDYKTNEVLMMAYMDEEAYNKTIETGIMTYHSRSRNELWIKGATSGHYQYLRELKLDCDSDTLLAKVVQVGAACHTGNYSCFFNELVKHEYADRDISKVLASLYDVVVDRKKNPKEGSYTNYLFDKGIDKILKKCGEEATEMVIAAKNPNAEELKYEIADLLYHMTVLMVECGVDWNDVAGELANR